MNKIEILVIDDEPQILKLLQITLESHDYKVIQAATGKEGIALTIQHPPDLILLDLGLPDKSGHQILTELKEWFDKPIIILSAIDNETDIIKALDNGASDYLTKPFRAGELLARIRTAIRGSMKDSVTPLLIFDELEIDLGTRLVKFQDELVKLTSTEYKLLSLLAKNEGRVLTHRFVLKEIWGVGHQMDTQYLRVFIASLRKKIEVNPNQPQHIITESGVGYRFQ